MKKTLLVLCSAAVLVGCDQNRGGAGSESGSDMGSGSSRSSTYQSPPMGGNTNTGGGLNSSGTGTGSGANGANSGQNNR